MKCLIAVSLREVHRMISRRIYVVSCIVLPLFSLLFMATIFGNGSMENLPVGVVDNDHTAASRKVIRGLEASPTLQVLRHYANEAEARKDVQRKRIYGYLVIPFGFAERAGNNQPVTLAYYYHNAMLSVGGELHSAFEQLLKPVSVQPIATVAVGLGEEPSAITSFLLPVAEEEAQLYNMDRNYAVYLSQPFFFVFLQILLLLVTLYSLGSEMKGGTQNDWLQAADGNMGVAVAGKLLPYTFLFSVMGIGANALFYGWMQLPLAGSLWTINGLTVLFILATQALALFLYEVFPVMSLVISVVSMVGSLGATLSGVTFPVSFMDTPVYAASYLFPIRHYVEAVQRQLYLDGTFADDGMNAVCLLLFLFLPLFLLPRLKNALITRKYEKFV